MYGIMSATRRSRTTAIRRDYNVLQLDMARTQEENHFTYITASLSISTFFIIFSKMLEKCKVYFELFIV